MGSVDETLKIQKCLRKVKWKRQWIIDCEEDEWASRLSMGEIQFLMIASVLHKNPTFVMLDEPTSALDPKSETVVLNALQQSGIAVLLVSHSELKSEQIKTIQMK